MRLLLLIALLALVPKTLSKKAEVDKKPEWAKKDIRDFTDADMERLLDQWEVSKIFIAFAKKYNFGFG